MDAAGYPIYATCSPYELHSREAAYAQQIRASGITPYSLYTLPSGLCPRGQQPSLLSVTATAPTASSAGSSSLSPASSTTSSPGPTTPASTLLVPLPSQQEPASASEGQFIFSADAQPSDMVDRSMLPRVFVHRLRQGDLVAVEDENAETLMPWLALTDEVPSDAGTRRQVHQCVICRKWFDRASSLATHQSSHNDERAYKCPNHECNKYFTILSNARRHARSHSEAVSSTLAPPFAFRGDGSSETSLSATSALVQFLGH